MRKNLYKITTWDDLILNKIKIKSTELCETVEKNWPDTSLNKL